MSVSYYDNRSRHRREAWENGKLLGWINEPALHLLPKEPTGEWLVIRWIPAIPFGDFPDNSSSANYAKT